jgi:hypothetical protein
MQQTSQVDPEAPAAPVEPKNAGLRKLADRLMAMERSKAWHRWLQTTTGVSGMAKYDLQVMMKNRLNFAKVVKHINMWKGWHRLKG